MHNLLITILLGILFPVCLNGQVQKLLDPNEDITTISSDLRELTLYKGTIYAYATSQEKEGLWRLDTALNQMELIVPGLNISQLVATDSLLFILASTLETGYVIWKSDGTLSGTSQLLNLPPGMLSGLEAYKNRAYFSITSHTSTITELWSTDGSDLNTHFLHNIKPIGFNRFAGNLAYGDDKVYFLDNETHTTSLVIETDGTPTGTLEKFSIPATNLSNIHVVDSLMYFVEKDVSNVFLWQVRRDTAVRIQQIPDIVQNFGNYIFQVHAYEGHHYFYGGRVRYSLLDSLYLFRTNGTFNHLEKIHTFVDVGHPLAIFSLPQGLLLTIQGKTFQPEMWTYTDNGISNTAIPLSQFTSVGQVAMTLDSVAIFELTPNQLMRSDGTLGGTFTIPNGRWKLDNQRRPDVAILGDYLYTGSDQLLVSRELFRTDGLTFELVDDIDPTPVSAFIRELNLMPFGLTFSAYSDTFGQELWISDGTPIGSGLLKDIFPDQGLPDWVDSSYPRAFSASDNLLYFSAVDSNSVYTFPYVTDGTQTGTHRISNFITSDTYSDFFLTHHSYWKGKLYFAGAKPISGLISNAELYQYDPISDTAILLKDIEPTPLGSSGLGSFPQQYRATDNYLFFLAKTVNEGMELWRTDGTSNGTMLVKDIAPGQKGGLQNSFRDFPSSFAGLDSLIIFAADNGTNGRQLWRSNGTESGTYLLQDSMKYRDIGAFHSMGNQVIFWERDFRQGTEIWASDGTEVGTKRLLNPTPGTFPTSPSILYTDEQIAFFTLYLAGIGFELWKTDGTEAGTQMVKDLFPGYKSSRPANVISIGTGQYVFWATDSLGERLLWQTDGTESGTYPVANYLPSGAGLFRQNQSVYSDGFLYFVAEDVQSGQALFRFDLMSTGLFDQTEMTSFEVYPNPADEKLTVRLKETAPNFITDIRLLNLQGQVVQQFSIPKAGNSEFTLLLSEHLAPGYYILALESGQKREFVKLMLW